MIRPLSLGLSLTCASALAGQGVRIDWTPTQSVVLDTDVTTVTTNQGTFTIRGGVFIFRNVTIPAGVTVSGKGSNPLVFILAGTMQIDGALSVRGGDGQRVDTLNSANFPSQGGVGNCGGGDGGKGSPNATDRSFTGEAGYGPFRMPNFGGGAGRINCADISCAIASAGGGGSFTTAGDPYYGTQASGTFVQPTGQGAFGCRDRNTTRLRGGRAGSIYFVDNNPSNNFFGIGVDVTNRRLIAGELPMLVGGSGGGGGGDYAVSCAASDPNFVQDEKGGGGGAGGGALLIAANGKVRVGPAGRIDADGGHGGGGAWAGSNNRGAGGGGGSGGMIVLYSHAGIDIEVHGETYANGDYAFSVSADGGIGQMEIYGSGGGTPIRTKYPPTSVANMNARPSGGMGGLGLIQFMAPPGNNADNTNTALDDNIILRQRGVVLSGREKQRFLAWRGFPDANGVYRDDRGNVLNIGANAGDIRPTPVLLPIL